MSLSGKILEANNEATFPTRRDLFQASATIIAGLLIFLALLNPLSGTIQEIAKSVKDRSIQLAELHNNGTLTDQEYTQRAIENNNSENTIKSWIFLFPSSIIPFMACMVLTIRNGKLKEGSKGWPRGYALAAFLLGLIQLGVGIISLALSLEFSFWF
jgi:hypothetical protein